jgi:hypothetical protein
MRLVAFIIECATIVRILSHLGEATDPPRLAAIRDRPEAARAARCHRSLSCRPSTYRRT